MKIDLVPGVRYSVTIVASVGSPLALQLLRNRLHASGFENITIAPRQHEVTVSGRYRGDPQTIDVAYDVRTIESVA